MYKVIPFINLISEIQTEKTFSAAHFVQTAGYDSPCFRFHGHDFHTIIEVRGEIKKDGMIVDFRKIKNVIDELDHKVLIPDLNTSGIEVIRDDKEHLEISVNNKEYKFPKSDVFIVWGVKVATSENIALYLKNKLSNLYPNDSFTVTVYEGNNSYAKT